MEKKTHVREDDLITQLNLLLADFWRQVYPIACSGLSAEEVSGFFARFLVSLLLSPDALEKVMTRLDTLATIEVKDGVGIQVWMLIVNFVLCIRVLAVCKIHHGESTAASVSDPAASATTTCHAETSSRQRS